MNIGALSRSLFDLSLSIKSPSVQRASTNISSPCRGEVVSFTSYLGTTEEDESEQSVGVVTGSYKNIDVDPLIYVLEKQQSVLKVDTLSET
jgi:hypothetical protein